MEAMENLSGINPCEYKVLILPDPVEEVSKGGIVLAPQVTEKEEAAQVRGTLVAVGGNAFEDWADPKPSPGDRVLFGKYKGGSETGADGKKYRICNDKDITAILA